MKKSLKDFLAFFGVKEGDVVKLGNITYKINVDTNNVPLLGNSLPLQALLDEEYEVVKPTKFGNLTCENATCDNCPMIYLDCNIIPKNTTLYDGLKIIFDNDTNHPIYKLVKKELDKDVDPESEPKNIN